MFFDNKLKNKNEPFLEPIFRKLRYSVARKDLVKYFDKNTIVLDYGCGPEAKFYLYLKSEKIPFKKYVGFDPLLKKDITKKDFLITNNLKKIRSKKYDAVSMFAVMEHLPYPNFNYKKITNLLKKNGLLFITTPTILAKTILEFLAYRLKIVSSREIQEHTHYFNLKEIKNIFINNKLTFLKGHTFEAFMNTYAVFKKD